jgi:hypothetical protein
MVKTDNVTVLQRLEDIHFFFKKLKCEFFRNELVVLGGMVGLNRWGPIPDRLGQLCLKKPTNQAELRSCLGAVNWIRRHVEDLKTTFVLSNLLKGKGKCLGRQPMKRLGHNSKRQSRKPLWCMGHNLEYQW